MKRGALRSAWLGLSLLACTPAYTPSGMKARAAEEWQCPESSIQVTNEGQSTFRVSGCGQSALYVCQSNVPTPADALPQSGLVSEEEFRYSRAGADCHKATRD
jgi:hypothetical protein